MLGDKAWLSVGVKRCSGGFKSGLCAGQSMPSSFQTVKTIYLWSSLCAYGHCHVKTGVGLPQTVGTLLSTMSLYAVVTSFVHAVDAQQINLQPDKIDQYQ